MAAAWRRASASSSARIASGGSDFPGAAPGTDTGTDAVSLAEEAPRASAAGVSLDKLFSFIIAPTFTNFQRFGKEAFTKTANPCGDRGRTAGTGHFVSEKR